MLHEYELTLIVRADLDDAVIEGLIGKIEAVVAENEGHILLRDDWGKRKLAYPIQKQLKGHYFLVNFLSSAAQVDELERKIRIEDKIVRFMTVRIADAVDVETRLEEAEIARKQLAEQARLKAEAEAQAAAEAEAAALAAAQAPPAKPAPVQEEQPTPEAPAS
jgi:small subunit ribosomal protein S6